MKKVLCPRSLYNDTEELLSLGEIQGKDYSPFFIAVEKNRIDVVKQLLDLGINPNVSEGLALSIAIRQGNTEMVSLLLDRGADVNSRGGLPLFVAVSYRRLEIVKLLLIKGANIFGECGYIQQPGAAFYEAIDNLNYEIFSELISAAKQKPTSEYHKIMENLLLSSIRKRFFAGADLILEEYELDRRYLDMAFVEALAWGNLNIIDKLISKGASCDRAVYIAIHHKHWDVVKYLINKGFDYKPNLCIVECAPCPELVELLLKQDVKDNFKKSAFKHAVEKGYKESVQIFLEHGVEPWPEIVSRLVEMGVGIFSL
jgi:ankyrin repeat protein